MTPTWYREPSETPVFILTIAAVLVLVGLTAGLTVCIVPIIVLIILVMSYGSTQAHHQELMKSATPVSPTLTPELYALVKQCERELQPGDMEVYVTNSREMNAYTFGLSTPKVVVLYSALFDVMDAEELKFIVGHEFGHAALGHTWLNTLLGGMAGVPMPIGAAVLLTLAFRWWNRICEYSADRAGLLACGSLNSATRALVKLVSGPIHSEEHYERIMAAIDAEDDNIMNVLAQSFATHPMIIDRIEHLRSFAAEKRIK
jgi:Zn-dependent protease with chaperone function